MSGPVMPDPSPAAHAATEDALRLADLGTANYPKVLATEVVRLRAALVAQADRAVVSDAASIAAEAERDVSDEAAAAWATLLAKEQIAREAAEARADHFSHAADKMFAQKVDAEARADQLHRELHDTLSVTPNYRAAYDAERERADQLQRELTVCQAMDMTATANQWETACKTERERAERAEAALRAIVRQGENQPSRYGPVAEIARAALAGETTDG